MSKPNLGFDDLLEIGRQQQYYSVVSHSCIKEFSPGYPKKEPMPFIADELPRPTGIFKYGTGARDRT